MQGFEFIIDVLKEYKLLAANIPDSEHFRISVNLRWEN